MCAPSEHGALASFLAVGAFEDVDIRASCPPATSNIARTPASVVCHYCRKARGVEHMIVDALLAAEPTLRLADKTEDPQEFVRLDDTIIKVTAQSTSSPTWSISYRTSDKRH